MFGTITVPKAPIEVQADDLVGHIVGIALIQRDSRDRVRDEAHCQDVACIEIHCQVSRDLAREYGTQMRYVTMPLRVAIRIRTDDESRMANLDVERGNAHFWVGSCADEACDDCDRPLWHHVVTISEGIICPFGRRFWSLARAILAKTYDGTPWDGRETLGKAARRA